MMMRNRMGLRRTLLLVIVAALATQNLATAFQPHACSSRSMVTPWRPSPSTYTCTAPLSCPTRPLAPPPRQAIVIRASATSDSSSSTMTASVFNLVKSIVGAGVLTLPAGIAAFGNAPSAVIPALVLIATMGTLSGYGFALIGRTCALTDTSSYRQAWSEALGPQTSWIPAWSVTLKTIAAALAYSMILADTFGALALTAGIRASKTAILTTMTTFILLPLCLLKNLSSLAPFSLLGTLGMLYTAVAMTIRYLTRSYLPPLGRWAADLPPALQPSFGTVGAAGVWNPAATILIGMLSTAYMAHFNAPKFYAQLKDNTVPRYIQLVSISFALSVALFAVVASTGFLTFGAHSAGLILNNYSVKDGLMGLSRLAVAMSLVFSFPLAFTGARDGVLDLLKIQSRSDRTLNLLTVGMLTAITILALIVPDVSFVLAFVGATLGNCLIYIFPAFMFKGAIGKLQSPTRLQKAEVKIALSSAALGLVFGVMGAIKAVQSIL